MDRRAFLGTLAGGLLAAPLAAEAQKAGKVWRIGRTSPSKYDTPRARPSGSPILQKNSYSAELTSS